MSQDFEALLKLCKTPEAEEELRRLIDILLDDVKSVTSGFLKSVLENPTIMSSLGKNPVEKTQDTTFNNVPQFKFGYPKNQTPISTSILIGPPTISFAQPSQSIPFNPQAGSPFGYGSGVSFSFGSATPSQSPSFSFGSSTPQNQTPFFSFGKPSGFQFPRQN